MTRTLFIFSVCIVAGGATGCVVDPRAEQIVIYMRENPEYTALPEGPQRMDAIFRYTRQKTGSNEEALKVLGSLATCSGARLKHPFNTGITAEGPLAAPDKAGHFFAHAHWRYKDLHYPIHLATFTSFFWEGLGEIKSWFGSGDGFDWIDLWANAVGREFGNQLYAERRNPLAVIKPSDAILHTECLRPQLAKDE